MSDLRINRRQLFALTGAAAAVGAGGGYLAAYLQTLKPKYTYDLRIRGGYAWLFQTAGGKTTIRLMCLKSASCSDPAHFLDHKMKLYMQSARISVDSSSVSGADGQKGRIVWDLDGPTSFTQGMGTDGIVRPPATNQGSLADPFGPPDPMDDSLWNDLVWVAGKEKPKSNASGLASRYLDLTEGALTVSRPENEQARVGRWKMNDSAGNPLKKALTDSFSLVWGSNDGLSIKTAAGQIIFTPTSDRLVMHLTHELDPAKVPLSDGYKLPHFNMLYDFVDGKSCDSVGGPPEYEKRTDLSGLATPGDFCPPMSLE